MLRNGYSGQSGGLFDHCVVILGVLLLDKGTLCAIMSLTVTSTLGYLVNWPTECERS